VILDARQRESRSIPLLLFVLIVGYAVALVTNSYSVFNHTWDEAMHVAGGLELLDRGTFTCEPQHPPLTRVAMALGPYFIAGSRFVPPRKENCNTGHLYRLGNRILYSNGPYDGMLRFARLGNLPFLLLLLVTTWIWAGRTFGWWPAVAASFFIATTPPMLGNAGLATLDVSLVGLGITSIYLFCLWIENPSAWRSVALGAVSGMSIMAKFSAIPFLGVSFVAIALARWLTGLTGSEQTAIVTKKHLKTMVLGLVTLAAVFWISYGLRLDSLVVPDQPTRATAAVDSDQGRNGLFLDFAERPLFPLFVREMVAGFRQVSRHNQRGHQTFLLGEISGKGWWYYYLVGLGIKTPIPLLILGLAGLGSLLWTSIRRADWRIAAPVYAFVAILAFASFYSNINLGIRHVLILYPMLAIGAAHMVLILARVQHGRTIAIGTVALLLIFQLASSVYAHPDNMAYFNLLAGPKPERILLTADLDWGQDLKRLGHEVRQRKIQKIAIAYNGSAQPELHLPAQVTRLKPNTRRSGWVAVSLWTLERSGTDYRWLKSYEPVTRIGRSIDLYFIPD